MAEIDKTLEGMPTTHALEYYKNHCEFLGYSVEEVNEFSIFCRHSRRDSIRLTLLNQNLGVLAQIMYVFPEKFQNDLVALYMYANELNYHLLFMKAYISTYEDTPPIIVLNSVHEGEYSRHSFANFIDNIDCEMSKFYSYPKTRDMWRSQDNENSF